MVFFNRQKKQKCWHYRLDVHLCYHDYCSWVCPNVFTLHRPYLRRIPRTVLRPDHEFQTTSYVWFQAGPRSAWVQPRAFHDRINCSRSVLGVKSKVQASSVNETCLSEYHAVNSSVKWWSVVAYWRIQTPCNSVNMADAGCPKNPQKGWTYQPTI